MRSTSRALTATLSGLALLVGITSCGKPAMLGTSSAAPGFGLLQARALHYIIDKRTEGGQTLTSDITVYDDGRIVVTADMTGAIVGPRAWISIRLSNLAGRTTWNNVVTMPFCVARLCPTTRKASWTFRTTPRIATQASNLWIKLDILG